MESGQAYRHSGGIERMRTEVNRYQNLTHIAVARAFVFRKYIGVLDYAQRQRQVVLMDTHTHT